MPKTTKSPRKHNPKWQDATRTERQQKRRAQLNLIAQAHGFASWSAYETAVLNGSPLIPGKPKS